MSTSPLPTPVLQPLHLVAGEPGTLPVIDSGAACCGGSSCATGK